MTARWAPGVGGARQPGTGLDPAQGAAQVTRAATHTKFRSRTGMRGTLARPWPPTLNRTSSPRRLAPSCNARVTPARVRPAVEASNSPANASNVFSRACPPPGGSPNLANPRRSAMRVCSHSRRRRARRNQHLGARQSRPRMRQRWNARRRSSGWSLPSRRCGRAASANDACAQARALGRIESRWRAYR